jgi:hypothetical protein
MDKKTKSIKYVKKINCIVSIDGEEYKEYEYGWFNSSISGVKRYHSALILLMKIEGCAKNLLEWLLYNMSTGGYISNNELTRGSFIKFFTDHKVGKKKPYSDNTVRISFQTLSKLNLLQQVKRGVYVANPEYFFTKDEQNRIKAIRMMLEFKNGVDVKITIDVTKNKEK